METTRQIEGFFLSFSPSEMKEVRVMLEDLDYTVDATGLKEFVLDMMAEGEKEIDPAPANIGGMVKSFLDEHPETVQMGVSAAFGVLDRIRKSRR
jgi:hypothetical protein